MKFRPGLFAVLILSAPVAVTSLALAQDAPPPQDSAPPPSRAGRVAMIDGLASYRVAAQDPWSAASPNLVLTAGSSLWTQPGVRAEIEIGAARVWLDGGTEIDVTQLDDSTVALGVPQGRIDLHLGGKRPEEAYIVASPAGQGVLMEDGLYRIIAGDAQNPGGIAVLDGEASFGAGNGSQEVQTGQAFIVVGDSPELQPASADPDDFDNWVDSRESSIQASVSARFLPPGIPGAEDLDQYGQWRTVPDYGNVWIPTDVPQGWQPYHNGNWRWVAPWGWTWVDDDPWGFAPFHYGRWALIGGWWAWVPGPVDPEEPPVYAPALVSFIGDPDAVAVGDDGPSVGWVPLGPGEVYDPGWVVGGIGFALFAGWNWGVPHHDLDRYNDGGRFRQGDFGDHRPFANERYATVVGRDTFQNSRDVGRSAYGLRPGADIRPAASFREARVPDAPTLASRIGNAGRPVQAPPRAAMPFHSVNSPGRAAEGTLTQPRSTFNSSSEVQRPALIPQAQSRPGNAASGFRQQEPQSIAPRTNEAAPRQETRQFNTARPSYMQPAPTEQPVYRQPVQQPAYRAPSYAPPVQRQEAPQSFYRPPAPQPVYRQQQSAPVYRQEAPQPAYHAPAFSPPPRQELAREAPARQPQSGQDFRHH